MAAFNSLGLSREQLRIIVGKDKAGKWISAASILKTLEEQGIVKKYLHGRIKTKCGYAYCKNHYILSRDILIPIFEDGNLLAKV